MLLSPPHQSSTASSLERALEVDCGFSEVSPADDLTTHPELAHVSLGPARRHTGSPPWVGLCTGEVFSLSLSPCLSSSPYISHYFLLLQFSPFLLSAAGLGAQKRGMKLGMKLAM